MSDVISNTQNTQARMGGGIKNTQARMGGGISSTWNRRPEPRTGGEPFTDDIWDISFNTEPATLTISDTLHEVRYNGCTSRY